MSSLAENVRMHGAMYRLEGAQYSCKHTSFPGRDICPVCNAKKVVTYELQEKQEQQQESVFAFPAQAVLELAAK